MKLTNLDIANAKPYNPPVPRQMSALEMKIRTTLFWVCLAAIWVGLYLAFAHAQMNQMNHADKKIEITVDRRSPNLWLGALVSLALGAPFVVGFHVFFMREMRPQKPSPRVTHK
jgi:hypothetical protein